MIGAFAFASTGAIAATTALVFAAASLAYACIALIQVVRFGMRRRAFRAAETAPPVTVLKPLAAMDERLYEDLRTFCDQDYPQFQIVFGARDGAMVQLVERLRAEFPRADLAFVATGRTQAANYKVANLFDMLGSAKHDLLIIADADTRVERGYLRRIAASFADEGVGAVTCPYRGLPDSSFASQLGALAIDDQFIPSVLVAALGPVRFCLGATMAVRRSALAAIGGFEALADQLADDRMLGYLVSTHGYAVALAPYVVEHVVAEAGVRDLWAHELRWARTNRLAQPAGYAFYFITYPLPLALVCLSLAPHSSVAMIAVAAALGLRLAIHYAARWALAASGRDAAWLIPVRDVLGLAVWGASWFEQRVRWGDRDLVVDSSGRIRVERKSGMR